MIRLTKQATDSKININALLIDKYYALYYSYCKTSAIIGVRNDHK